MQFTKRQFNNFMAKIKKTRSCWIWNGYTMKHGYGRVNVSSKTILAHRLSWLIHNGEIPKGEGFHGICVLHRCDNPTCVNPKHLFLGTHKDNMIDAVKKGRHYTPDWKGDNNPHSKVNLIKKGEYAFAV